MALWMTMTWAGQWCIWCDAKEMTTTLTMVYLMWCRRRRAWSWPRRQELSKCGWPWPGWGSAVFDAMLRRWPWLWLWCIWCDTEGEEHDCDLSRQDLSKSVNTFCLQTIQAHQRGQSMSAPNIPLYTFRLWIFWIPKGVHYTRNALPTTKVHAKHRNKKRSTQNCSMKMANHTRSSPQWGIRRMWRWNILLIDSGCWLAIFSHHMVETNLTDTRWQ